jgi:hypothetical protein
MLTELQDGKKILINFLNFNMGVFFIKKRQSFAFKTQIEKIINNKFKFNAF